LGQLREGITKSKTISLNLQNGEMEKWRIGEKEEENAIFALSSLIND